MAKEDKDKKDLADVPQSGNPAEPEGNEVEIPAGMGALKTPADLRAAYPDVVKSIEDEIVTQIGKCSAKQIKDNLPELYDRIVEALRGKGGPNLNVPGFLLERDDPFGEGTLRFYEQLKGLSGLQLPYVLPAKDKGQGQINTATWKRQYEKSDQVKAEFKDEKAYYAYKTKIAVQVLEYYILLAEGGCDPARAEKARVALKNVK